MSANPTSNILHTHCTVCYRGCSIFCSYPGASSSCPCGPLPLFRPSVPTPLPWSPLKHSHCGFAVLFCSDGRCGASYHIPTCTLTYCLQGNVYSNPSLIFKWLVCLSVVAPRVFFMLRYKFLLRQMCALLPTSVDSAFDSHLETWVLNLHEVQLEVRLFSSFHSPCSLVVQRVHFVFAIDSVACNLQSFFRPPRVS